MKEQLYIGCKIIRAYPGTNNDFNKLRGHSENSETEEGYIVYYPDNYVSWSPKDVFEQAYRLISPGEMTLISKEN